MLFKKYSEEAENPIELSTSSLLPIASKASVSDALVQVPCSVGVFQLRGFGSGGCNDIYACEVNYLKIG